MGREHIKYRRREDIREFKKEDYKVKDFFQKKTRKSKKKLYKFFLVMSKQIKNPNRMCGRPTCQYGCIIMSCDSPYPINSLKIDTGSQTIPSGTIDGG